MKTISTFVFGIGVLLLVIPAATSGASSPKALELNRKVTEISSLQRIVANQVDIAVQTRDQLQKQIKELAIEINQEMIDRPINTYPAAVKILRIKYNINLIQQISAYIACLDQREQYFRIGNETLEHLQQQVNDDLQLIRTLNDMEVDELIHKINSVLDEYIPETKKPVFTIDNIQKKSAEKIWSEIAEKN